MGNEQAQSITESNQAKKIQRMNTEEKVDCVQEQYFFVEKLDQIKLQSRNNDTLFYWVDPRVYKDENGNNLKAFKQKLKIQQVSSIGSLQSQLSVLDSGKVVLVITAASFPDQSYKYMNQQKRITQVILFCQNQQRANMLMSNFPKITSVGLTSGEVIDKIEVISQKYSAQSAVGNSVLFMTQADAASLNKYRLNYYCLTNQKTKRQAKEEFYNFARSTYPDQLIQIQQFAKDYSLSLQDGLRNKQTLQWAFRDSFYWDLVQILLKTTCDPRRLAYIRLPVKDMYQAISEGYRQMKRKPADLFIVLQLNQHQKRKLAQNQENFLIFTTFIKGYTVQKEALKQFKRRGGNAFKFDIILAKKLHEQLDFGFVQSMDKISKNVIFNIYNFFKITEISVNARRGTLQYGSLAQAFKVRLDPSARSKLKNQQRNLLRNYDYLQDLMSKIKNQGNVLQLSGYYKESIQLYDRKLQQITRTNKPAAMLDEFRIQKGDALKMNQQFDLAQKQYFSVVTQKLRLVAKVKLTQLYFMTQNTQKVQQMISDLQKQAGNLKDWGFIEEYFRAENYIGLNLMKQLKYKQANRHFKKLRSEMSVHYDYRVEGIPLVHQIYRNLALSQTKVNNHEQALNLLNSTKSWQQLSEGKGPTLILTEKMIQNVYHSKGDKQGMQESKQAVEKMMIEQSAVDFNFVDASRGAVKAQQIIQRSLVDIDLVQTTPSSKDSNIDQSAVVVDI